MSKTIIPQSRRNHNSKDFTGRRFGKLFVMNENPIRARSGHVRWNCTCDCGKLCTVVSRSLVDGSTQSCGCNRIKHGLSRSPIYQVWIDMIRSCYHRSARGFNRYGGRGITVCERWRSSFYYFHSDMIDDFRRGLTIERIDNDGPYCKDNCRWATRKEQAANTRTSRLVSFKGCTRTLTQWSECVGVSVYTLWSRLNAGWSIERTLTTPTLKRS